MLINCKFKSICDYNHDPESDECHCNNCDQNQEPEIPEQDIPQPEIGEFVNAVSTAPAGQNSALLLIDRLPKFEYRITSFNFPAVQANPVTFSTPPVVGVFKVSPVKLDWGDVSVTSILSEDYSNYFAIFDWMWENIHTLEHKEMNSDATIIIFNNQKQMIRKINLIAVFPTGLDELRIDIGTAEHATFNARFKVEMFTHSVLSGLKNTPSIDGYL